MPDITATRPTSGTPIETAWGDQVHDAIEGIQAGTATVNISAAQSATVAVTFPRAYVTPPVVLVAQAANSNGYVVAVGAITTTGCTLTASLRATGTGTAAIPVTWLAIGTPA
jgi:hypothetical protein